MSKFPSMPLFIDAYLADTTHLSAEEHGAYLLLLMAMWRHDGSVPDVDKDLARMCRIGRRRWPYVKARLMPFLLAGDGVLSQKRLRFMLERCHQIGRKSAQNVYQPLKAKSKKNSDLTTDSRARANQNHIKKERKKESGGNGSAAIGPSPALDAATARRAKETLTADEVAAIQGRLSFHKH